MPSNERADQALAIATASLERGRRALIRFQPCQDDIPDILELALTGEGDGPIAIGEGWEICECLTLPNGANCYRVRASKSASFPLHRHSQHAEVFQVLSGRVLQTGWGATRVLTPGGPESVAAFSPNQPHGFHVLDDAEIIALFVPALPLRESAD
jgi:quercetin dioxygenase-like cupin family protein